MARRWVTIAVLAACLGVASPWFGLAPSAGASQRGGELCSAGAHTLSPPGSHVYPETGNGGYTSLHTLVHLVYDSTTNTFLPGNRVVLTDRATKCLTSFSLDFERRSATQRRPGPERCALSGRRTPRRLTFAQPTYPGDPNGQDDPDPGCPPQASQAESVVGAGNPIPPACSRGDRPPAPRRRG